MELSHGNWWSLKPNLAGKERDGKFHDSATHAQIEALWLANVSRHNPASHVPSLYEEKLSRLH